ncbi:MAG: glutamate-5-semialdehyde dehydrogenase, partial [Candidatus Omnitrophota bacterium]
MAIARKGWKTSLENMLGAVEDASIRAAQVSSPLKKAVLRDAARELLRSEKALLRSNGRDLRSARREGFSAAMIDRLTLTRVRLREMARAVTAVAALEDPIGQTVRTWKRPNGLKITRVTVPIGVILIIYESRPNVTVECASLCLKSGNAVILRGGRESIYSNRALVSVFKRVLRRHALPEAAVSLVETTDRAAVDALLKRNDKIHLVIPRGGESLIRKVVRSSRIPVIKHYQGICHVYVDEHADILKAISIVVNAKMQRTGVCNAAETLLVHRDIAGRFLPLVGQELRDLGCELRADPASRRYLPWAKAARPSDFGREFLDKILAVRTVAGVGEAVEHIRRYGSAHTDAIVTEDPRAAGIFKAQVDSSSVMVNASTRFSDGFQYGFGAEIGISTDKIHARGPMGLKGLTSYKYL